MNARNDTTPPIRTIIADDHPLVLLAIENLMSRYPQHRNRGACHRLSQLFAEAGRVACDLVVMDLYMPGGSHGDGLEMIRQFRARYPEIVVVILTMETDGDALQKVIALGANAVVSKRDRIDLIHVAIITALAHECYLGQPFDCCLPMQRSRAGSTTCGKCCRDGNWRY